MPQIPVWGFSLPKTVPFCSRHGTVLGMARFPKMIKVNVDEALHEAVDLMARSNQTTSSALTRMILAKWIEDEERRLLHETNRS